MRMGYETKGEYAVGTFSFTVIDENREEELGTAGGKRRMAVRMYYPVLRTGVIDCERATVLTPTKQEAIKKAYHIGKKVMFSLAADCYENVPCVPGRKFPLVLFGHGYQGYVEQNTVLCCDLASEGYIVASIGHAYEAVMNEYEDGSCDYYDKTLNRKLMSPFLPLLIAQSKLLKKDLTIEEAKKAFAEFQDKYGAGMLGRTDAWVKDSLAVLNRIEQLNETEDFRLFHAIDFPLGVAATGHSFGGATAYNLCLRDPRLVCGLNMDGAVYGENENLTMEKPFMTIGCRENRNVEVGALADTKAPAYYVAFDGMKHLGFTDAKFLMKVKNFVGTLEPERLRDEINACHLGFLNHYLKKDETAVIVKNDDVIDVISRNVQR